MTNPVEKIMRDVQARLDDPIYQAELAKQRAEEEAADAAWKLSAWKADTLRLAPVQVARFAFGGMETPAVQAVRRWLDSDTKKHLVLRGGVGSGKSTAACFAVKHWCEPTIVRMDGMSDMKRHSMDVVWLRPDQLVSAVMHAYDKENPKMRTNVVIDDMGRETKQDFPEALCEVIDSGAHRLLITTNLRKEQFRQRYTDLRLIDRMNDTCVAVDLPDKSMRRQDGDF